MNFAMTRDLPPEHDNILRFSDRRAGLDVIVAFHQPHARLAMGATRLLPYPTAREALADALRLSEAMTYKAAAAGLPIGGAKAVIIGDPRRKTEELFRAYARFVDSLRGRFVTGQDLNVSRDDVRVMAEETRHVVGLGTQGPAEMTARGVVAGLTRAARLCLGASTLAGRRVAIQGVGAVGARVAELLSEVGAELVIADTDPERANALAAQIGADTVEADAILEQEVDIFAPCGQGGVFDQASIPRIKARIVGGAANNQLSDPPRDAERLAARGIAYCPDFVLNAGGLIEVYCEYAGTPHRVSSLVAGIADTLEQILTSAQRTGMSTHAAARAYAERRRRELAAEQVNHEHSKSQEQGAWIHGR